MHAMQLDHMLAPLRTEVQWAACRATALFFERAQSRTFRIVNEDNNGAKQSARAPCAQPVFA
jgi:hypothetical protein